jgi:hypothetical protein
MCVSAVFFHGDFDIRIGGKFIDFFMKWQSQEKLIQTFSYSCIDKNSFAVWNLFLGANSSYPFQVLVSPKKA